MKKKRWRFKAMVFAMIFSLLALSSCGKPKFEATYDWPMKDFSYINQDEKQVSLADLKGKVWLANFIFTNCDTACPPMTANMARVQQKMAEEKIDAQIVSFSVDPSRDTPETLKEFAGKFQADFSNWHFLTGYTEEEIKDLAKAFKAPAEADPGSDQFLHSTKIYLINQDGIIVKGYNGLDVPYDEIISDLKALTK
ncbi:SCO family protein [Calidifontibacillus erzurumensis]|uniref:SCO family protein n=1 Tax=Calidifontibacillus erzurumensis TaxID=2741433 RepID=A0A8J8KBH7_9BACI|nr:SCO family protein [Calidifontibacillus erzurumensis]NSL51637.1 SCO family protein [Calidifontibacillus erzurumensis]